MFNLIGDLAKRLILLYLEPSDIRNLITIDKYNENSCSIESITEDPIFWENYLKFRNRNVPKRLPKVSAYYLGYYEYKYEAKAWVNYMQYDHNKLHDPIYSFDIKNIDPKIFITFPKIEQEIIKLQNIYNTSGEESIICLFFEHKDKEYVVYFVSKNPINNPIIIHPFYEQTIIVSKEDMMIILSIFISNGLYFKDYDGSLLMLPWNIN